MLESFIGFFVRRHLLTNILFVAILISGVYFWQITGKEQMPNVSFDTLRITVSYPGASARDVEYFVTRPLEEAIQGIDGVHLIRSSSGSGVSSIIVELEQDRKDRDAVISTIKTAALDVRLPDDVADEPQFREFKTSQMAVLDVFLYDKGTHLLDRERRDRLQTYARALESRLISLPEVSSVGRSGYLKQEVRILVDPVRSRYYQIPFSTVVREIRNNNLRVPAGSLEDDRESRVSLVAELDNLSELENLIIQGDFSSEAIRLKDLAMVTYTYEKNRSVMKINGHEAVGLNVVKSSSAGIISAVDAVKAAVEEFERNGLEETGIILAIMDDESVDVRNRLSLILQNGLLGFILIIVTLLLFLDLRSSLWVAMGIPFSFCFTMVAASRMGYTINNMTLAAVIIVMGMIVDDAIVVAENITRMRSEGAGEEEAAVKGTAYMVLPVIASVLTTCVAFFPLLYFEGRFGKFVSVIPAIITLMLAASLLESIFILPSHMVLRLPFERKKADDSRHWFLLIEDAYGWVLGNLLKVRYLLFLVFILLFVFSLNIFNSNMKFVMFPNEEATEISLTALAPAGTKSYRTAELAQSLEDIIVPSVGKDVAGFRTYIARSRRGGAVKENELFMLIELFPRDKRSRPLNRILAEWEKQAASIKGLSKIRFSKNRFGQTGGTPIELVVQENNDKVRDAVVGEAIQAFDRSGLLANVEKEEPVKNKEYRIGIRRDMVKRLGIDPVSIGSALRGALEGIVLYELRTDDEEVDVRLSVDGSYKNNINQVLGIPVVNRGNYLVPLRELVTMEEVNEPESIAREELRRTTKVYADIKEGADTTPLEIATQFEGDFFAQMRSKYPSAILYFGGEVQDTRESQSQFLISIVLIVALIYIVLALLFNSLVKPLLIMLSIPFGVVGVILAFHMHGIALFGFFAAIGVLGLSGVVVNDSIVMLVKLDREKKKQGKDILSSDEIADIAKTRLRAVMLTTLTTVAGLFPTAYGWAGFDSMLSEMMLAMGWGLLFATFITLLLVPSLYSALNDLKWLLRKVQGKL